MYPFQPSNLSLTRAHRCLGGQVINIPVSLHDVWLVPCADDDADVDGRPTMRLNVFTPEDPIDAVAAFPPHLLLPPGIIQGALANCPCLCMPLTVDFDGFHMLVAEEEMEPKKRRSSLHQLTNFARMNAVSFHELTTHVNLNLMKQFWVDWWTPRRVHCESEAPSEGRNLTQEAWEGSTKATRLWVLFIDEEGDDDASSSVTVNRGAMDLLRESLNVYYMGYLPQWKAAPKTDALKE